MQSKVQSRTRQRKDGHWSRHVFISPVTAGPLGLQGTFFLYYESGSTRSLQALIPVKVLSVLQGLTLMLHSVERIA